jgi:mediator of replication checkpoint protein 1
MASSRESSPVMDAASPTQLTPNSKVKALLASLDKDSDDESISKSPRRRILTSITKSAVPPHPIEISGLSTNADEKSDSEEEEIFRPKGRMAGRMQANKAVSEDSEGSIDENPQARVKKVLKAKSKSPTTTTNKNDSQESEDSDLPVRPRKRKVRTPRHTPNSSPEKGTLSPGLFVSPRNQKLATTSGNGSDSDELPYANNLASNSRFLALVEQKKEERKAREAQAAKERAEKAAERSRQRILSQEQDDLDKSDDDVERRLTQRAPTRKASKRALEDMHRETQRLSRNQQLAHNATTKKKYTRSGLLAKFNYQTEKNIPSEPEHAPSSSPLEPNSDVDMRGTPPTSPASHRSPGQQSKAEGGEVSYNTDEEPLGLKDFNELRSSPPSNLDKGKGKAIEEVQEVVEVPKKPRFTQRSIRVRPPKIGDKQLSTLDESDSDLEIVAVKIPTLKKKIELIFDRVPENQGRESHSIHTLRMLAHLSSPGKQNTGRNKKPSITTSELQVSLQQRARQQAAKEREERLEALRAKGVIIQTAEEREREMAEVDDLLARARQEGEAIMKRERAAAKKQKKDEGEPNHLQDDSDDEDWEENKAVTDEAVPDSGSEDDGDSSQNDTSGESDEENGEEEAMDVDDPEAENSPSNLDQEADETNKYESELRSQIDAEMTRNYDAEEDGEEEISVQNLRRPRKSKVISDDEDTDGEIDSSKSPAFSQTASPSVQVESPNAPNSVLRSASKTFIPGLPVVGVAGLGLTQIFAGTMDTSQSQDPEASPVGPAPTFQSNRDGASMAFLRRLPVPELPPFVATLEDTQDSEIVPQSQLTHIPESQTVETQAIRLNFTQSQFHGFDSLVEGTQMSPFPDATQDVGFQHMTPIKGRFVDGPPSTIDTVVLGASVLPATAEETPVVKKKGKLRRRAPVIHFSDEEDNTEVNASKMYLDEDELDVSSNAFDVMRKSSNKKVLTDKFNKKKSDAKQMVQEQAEESEDEYAGLGGASDDESGDEEDALVKEMIDDEAGKDANERELAAFYA